MIPLQSVMDAGRELSADCHSGPQTRFGDSFQTCFSFPKLQASSLDKQSGAVATIPGPESGQPAPSVPPIPQQ